MQFTTGVVRDGKIEFKEHSGFPEGTAVTIYLYDESCEVSPEEEAEIQKGIEEAERGELHPWEEVLASIRQR